MKDTRQRLIDTARELFYRHGFQATGVDVIAKNAGTTRQTLYNHFETKDQLVVEVIKNRDARWRQELSEEVRRRGGSDPIAQLRSVFHVLSDWFASDEFAGCLFISAAMEFPATTDPIHRAAKANFDAIRELIASIAADSGCLDPQTFASKFNIIIEGAIIAELVDRNHEAATQAADLADLLIEQMSRTAEKR